MQGTQLFYDFVAITLVSHDDADTCTTWISIQIQ